MKEKVFSTVIAIALFIFPNSALASDSENNEPEHSITDAHEGVEGAELFAAGAGLVVALGIAFTIGRRSRKKD
ncbi:hypothetical protein MCEMZLE22_00868 [actinobacterium SCGC AAA044-D11]|uniref:Unannotated protein n=1 Tax=freshwater metagenome TaxID=449393 RepID=A0A6J6GIC6_9ZZZZ|nr:hypothetical protein [Actinomycetota bacterium]MTA24766.1 hypothetical protein [Actinomycetota bacterium]